MSAWKFSFPVAFIRVERLVSRHRVGDDLAVVYTYDCCVREWKFLPSETNLERIIRLQKCDRTKQRAGLTTRWYGKMLRKMFGCRSSYVSNGMLYWYGTRKLLTCIDLYSKRQLDERPLCGRPGRTWDYDIKTSLEQISSGTCTGINWFTVEL